MTEHFNDVLEQIKESYSDYNLRDCQLCIEHDKYKGKVKLYFFRPEPEAGHGPNFGGYGHITYVSLEKPVTYNKIIRFELRQAADIEDIKLDVLKAIYEPHIKPNIFVRMKNYIFGEKN